MSRPISSTALRRLLILIIIAPHLAAGVWSYEWFPFSSYPMYSTVRSEPVYRHYILKGFRQVEVNGEVRREEVLFRSREYLWPFDEPGLMQSFAGLVRAKRFDDVTAGLTEIAERHRYRQRRYPERNYPEIHGLALYRTVWRALPGAPNIHEPEQVELIREVTLQ